ncbi:hypothetical protein COW98_00205 [Candidatus Roizmanbacteria bacterium CG22_combo_CG10-13_8_21_14_all_35_9]|uniref:Methyltransferase n=1 Tax=Candidatus Roizmanbacteria bacterium CG22_combo_CG10-13_8_21_14_all_35_9 TaxID=1974861 RepID=A0A2H0BZL9_9BACT|nr:MAG: hypothetical protein COW98_00205 [Candidatus Roizmanbacteria bacterium CG22_combo_CG10-13_8_21_14_all_35_9]
MKKKIAWGTSKLLEMYLDKTKINPFAYCVDNFFKSGKDYGMPIKKSESLLQEERGTFQIIIFAVSSKSLQEISHELSGMGLCYGKDFIFYSDFFYLDFLKKAETALGFKLNPEFYKFALSHTLNSKLSIHTTILGSWLFLELINSLNNVNGSLAEVGAFEGGNALCGLNFMTKLNSKKFYVFDSFEGFPELSKNDPLNFHKGDYNIEATFQDIKNSFLVFPEAIVIKGFVPETFKEISGEEKFSLVFYDCDIYQPAIDTFNFFWDKIVPGGYLLIHDYETQEGGFTGVKKATNEFFGQKNVKIFSFFENTMAIIKK